MNRKMFLQAITMALIFTALSWFLVDRMLWSLNETIEYMGRALRDPASAIPSGVVVQFWQNFAIFMANRARLSKSPNRNQIAAIWLSTWLVSAVIDALTNLFEWQSHQPVRVTGDDPGMQDFVGGTFVVLLIFAEEVVSWTLPAAASKWNDVLVSLGKKPFGLFTWIDEVGDKMTPNFGGGNKGPGGGPPKWPAPSQQPKPQPQQQKQQPKPQPQKPPQKPNLVKPGDQALRPQPVRAQVEDEDMDDEYDTDEEVPDRDVTPPTKAPEMEDVRLPDGRVVRLNKPRN